MYAVSLSFSESVPAWHAFSKHGPVWSCVGSTAVVRSTVPAPRHPARGPVPMLWPPTPHAGPSQWTCLALSTGTRVSTQGGPKRRQQRGLDVRALALTVAGPASHCSEMPAGRVSCWQQRRPVRFRVGRSADRRGLVLGAERAGPVSALIPKQQRGLVRSRVVPKAQHAIVRPAPPFPRGRGKSGIPPWVRKRCSRATMASHRPSA